MKVKEFETNKNEAIKNIQIVTDYVPYIEKVSQCKSIAKATSHKEVAGNEIFIMDSPTRRLFFVMKLVELYTNIEFDETELVKAYDILKKNGIIDILFTDSCFEEEQNGVMIPYNEYEEFKTIMDMTMDDMYENEKATSTVLNNMKDALGMMVVSMFNAMEDIVDENEKIEE